MAQKKTTYKEWKTPEALLQIEGWARDGLNNEQIAHNIGISRVTFQKWLKNHADIAAALKEGKKPVDLEVENALLKNALGFSVQEKKIVVYTENGEKKQRTEITDRYIKPDTTAIIFFLKNRLPDKWRNSNDLVIEADISMEDRVDFVSKYLTGENDAGEEES